MAKTTIKTTARTTRRANTSPAPSAFVKIIRACFLLAVGFTGGMGTAAYFTAYVNDLPIPLSAPPTRDANLPAADSVSRTRRETLEFHETLRQRHVVPESATDDAADDAADNGESAPQTAAETPPPQESLQISSYYLQLGTFAQRAAAEELRGSIALSGGQASIHVTGESFRVLAGPYVSAAAAEEFRATFALQGYNNVQLIQIERKN